MEFIEVQCPVCSTDHYKTIFPDTLGKRPPVFGYKWTPEIRKTYRIVQCECCGHFYCSPRLKNMYAYYQEVEDEGYIKNISLRVATANKVIKKIRQFMPQGKLLDVGCSTGDFLMVAQKYYEAEGLELSEWALKIASNQGLKVYDKTLEALAQATQNAYDVITLWGVIEHLEYPLKEIQIINKLLRNNGIVCFWTGDMNSIFAKIFRHKFWYILGQHVQYFSRNSLDTLMQQAGFERVYNGIYPYVINLGYLGISLSRYPLVGKMANKIFQLSFLKDRTITLKLSSEIFAIYRKIRNP